MDVTKGSYQSMGLSQYKEHNRDMGHTKREYESNQSFGGIKRHTYNYQTTDNKEVDRPAIAKPPKPDCSPLRSKSPL